MVRSSSRDFAKSRVRVSHLVEQAHVLDRDDCLVGECIDQLNLLVGKRLDGLAHQDDHTDRRSARSLPQPSLYWPTAILSKDVRKLALRRGQPSAAVQASMGKARILGLIIDRREVGDPGAFDSKPDEELMEEARNRAAALGLPPPGTSH